MNEGAKGVSIKSLKQIGHVRAAEYQIISKFPKGYRSLEDITNLPPYVLVAPSQNVYTNVSDRIKAREGYTLDGSTADPSNIYPIRSAFDYEMHIGVTQHVRVWNQTMEYRYIDASNVVTWRTLYASVNATNDVNFANWWDTTNLQTSMLWVDGTSNVFSWSGGVTTIASVGTNTLTKTGSQTWAELGFTPTGTVTIDGVNYAYTGGSGTTTLTGVAPDPAVAAPPIIAGDIALQTVVVTANSAITALPDTFANQLIAVARNQLYVGALEDRSVYISKVNTYLDFSFATPRVVGEGALDTLDSEPRAFVAQESGVFVSAGQDQWYSSTFTLSSDNTKEDLQILRLKTTGRQGAQSQALVTKIKNSVAFLSNEPIFNEFGSVANIYQDLQMTNLSNSIKLDFAGYDFTDGQAMYDPTNYYIWISVPKEGLVRIYNLQKGYWEPPWILPIAKFSIIDGEIYGHSYLVPETYKMMDGFNDNGNPIYAIAAFAYQNNGLRPQFKTMSSYYAEGYISSNTTLTMVLKYEFGGSAGISQYNILGTDTSIIFATTADGSIGKNPIGENPIGSVTDSPDNLPKFRVVKTFIPNNCFEFQVQFTSNDIDQQWEILAHGGNQQLATATNANIKQ